jgi:hypothetical protein
MPFELGLAVSLAQRGTTRHQFRLLESRPFRLQQSLSDLNGFDPYIHHGTIDDMIHAIRDVFTDARPFPVATIRQVHQVYRALRTFAREKFGAASPYSADRFRQLVTAGRTYVELFSRDQ